MAIKTYEEMNALELDILKEIGSIGGGNAATALSSMLNAKVNMAVPEVQILGFNEALSHLGYIRGDVGRAWRDHAVYPDEGILRRGTAQDAREGLPGFPGDGGDRFFCSV